MSRRKRSASISKPAAREARNDFGGGVADDDEDLSAGAAANRGPLKRAGTGPTSLSSPRVSSRTHVSPSAVSPLSPPPPPLITPLGVLLGIALGIAAGALGVVLTHARLQKIPVGDAARAIVKRVPCVLGEFCSDKDRPVLESGRASHRIWDMPRYLVKSKFEEYRSIFPGVQVSYLWDDPVVLYFDNAISDRDIQMMIDVATPRFARSTVVQPDGSSIPDPSRTSDTAWIHFDLMDKKFASIVTRLVSLAGFQLENAESLGVNRHREGQFFKMHYDFVHEEGLRTDPAFPSCQRAATVLAYLTDVEEGGETVFVRDDTFGPNDTPDPQNPDHLIVRPKKGRVLVWFDMHPYSEEVDFRTYHGGRTVKKGEKIAATIFIRNCSRTGSYGAAQH